MMEHFCLDLSATPLLSYLLRSYKQLHLCVLPVDKTISLIRVVIHLYIATVIKFLATYVYIFLLFFLIFLLDFIIVTINLIQLLAAILIRINYLSIYLSIMCCSNTQSRHVTKISSCQVNTCTTSRQGIKELGISFGSIFLSIFL